MIKNIEDLKNVIVTRWSEMNELRDYLNEAGLAKMEAYRAIYFHLGFINSLEELKDYEEYQNLINIGGKHPEYYRTIRLVNRGIDNVIKGTY